MTVKELIDALALLPPSANVQVYSRAAYGEDWETDITAIKRVGSVVVLYGLEERSQLPPLIVPKEENS